MLLAGLTAYLANEPKAIPAVVGKNLYHQNMDTVDEAIIKCLASYSVVLSMPYCHKVGSEFVAIEEPDPMVLGDSDQSLLVNTLTMMGLADSESGKLNPLLQYVMDQVWIHGCDIPMSSSNAAYLHTASTLADPISCLISAITACYGILHFGTAESSYQMLQEISTPSAVAGYIQKCKSGKQKLFGVGHRIYKSSDPRVKPAKDLLELVQVKGYSDPLFEVALEIERQVSEDLYFRDRKLCVSGDLFWPLIFTALYGLMREMEKRFVLTLLLSGIRIEAAFPILLCSRIVGFMAHWREAMSKSPPCSAV